MTHLTFDAAMKAKAQALFDANLKQRDFSEAYLNGLLPSVTELEHVVILQHLWRIEVDHGQHRLIAA